MSNSDYALDIDEKEHAKRLLRRLDSMRRNEKHCDLVISVEGEKLHVNKDVMCAASDYFDAMFSHDTKEKQKGVVKMKDVLFSSVEKCINFIYSGKMSVSMDECEELLYSASLMQLNEVRDKISLFLVHRLSLKSFFNIKKIATKFSLKSLNSVCDKFASDHLFHLTMFEEFNDFDMDYVSFLLSSKESSGRRDEDRKMEMVLKWINSDLKNREKYFLTMTKSLDIAKLTVGYVKFLVNNQPLCMQSPEFTWLRVFAMTVTQDAKETGPPGKTDIPLVLGVEPSNSFFMFHDRKKVVQHYRPSQKKLTRMCSYCDGMEGKLTACMVGKYLYVFCRNKKTFRLSIRPENSTWNQLIDMLHDHGKYLCCAVHEYDIYVGGNNKMERYRTEGEGKWENVDLNGNICNESALVSFRGFLFCIGGRGGGRESFNSVMKYVSSSSAWTSVTPMNFERFGASATVFHEKLYVAGGGDESWFALEYFEVYDCLSDLWTVLPQMLSTRYMLCLCVVDNKIFAVGDKSKFVSNMEVYDATKRKWLEDNFKDLKVESMATVPVYIP